MSYAVFQSFENALVAGVKAPSQPELGALWSLVKSCVGVH